MPQTSGERFLTETSRARCPRQISSGICRLRPQLTRLLLIISRGSLIFELFRDRGGVPK
jgi:hypothetical protein